MNPQKLLDNFSTHLKNVIARAISLAHNAGLDHVEPVHLFLGILEEPGSVAMEVLKKANFPVDDVRRHAPKKLVERNADGRPVLPDLSATASRIIEKSLLVAFERGHNYIGIEHLLIALIDTENPELENIFNTANIDRRELTRLVGIALAANNPNTTIDDMIETMGGEEEDALPAADTTLRTTKKKKNVEQSALEYFTVNLTDKAVEKKLDPVIGRETEINRVINILCRRTKNNPVLIGEPGVGKTAIVEGLAKRICAGDVPDILLRKKILSLDLTLMVAGTIYRGEFEARLKQVIDELAHNEHCILFIDELHTIIGAGSNQGTLDAANILKPALARGQLHCIGATTYDEYKKYVTSDPALERRFQPVFVAEPTPPQTVAILSGVKKYYEEFHNLTITPAAIESAVTLSNKYLHDAYQPDKAIDILDEAAAAVKVKKYKNASSQKLAELEREITETEKKIVVELKNKNKKAAAAHKKALAKLKKELKIQEKTKAKKDKKTVLSVEPRDIVSTLADRLGVDKAVLESSEWDMLESASKMLKERLIGQDAVIDTVVRTLKERYLGLGRKGKPFASFLFVGPSGVGKTELAKLLAEGLYHDDKALIKLDMSEFAEPHSVAKILGSPAGYIGYKDRNRLFDELRRRPYSIILLDEIDKAHSDVRKLLLQMLDEGELTDAGGKKVHFNHAIIILTANIGSELFKSGGFGFGENVSNPDDNSTLHKKITSAVKEELGPAIVSRLDKVCVFGPLNKEHIERIIAQEIAHLSRELSSAKQLSITADAAVLAALAKESYHPDLGARPVQHLIERIVPELVIDLLKKQDGRKKKKNHYTLTQEHEAYVLK